MNLEEVEKREGESVSHQSKQNGTLRKLGTEPVESCVGSTDKTFHEIMVNSIVVSRGQAIKIEL